MDVHGMRFATGFLRFFFHFCTVIFIYLDTYIKVEAIFSPEKYFQHLQDRSSGFIVRNQNCAISKELAALVKTLKEVKHTAGKKKRSSSLPRSTELYQKKRKPSPLNIKQ